METVTLQDIKLAGNELTVTQKDLLRLLLTKRCKHETVQKLDRILEFRFLNLPNSWYWERLIVTGTGTNTKIEYIAGQDYTSEIAFIRNDILKKGY